MTQHEAIITINKADLDEAMAAVTAQIEEAVRRIAVFMEAVMQDLAPAIREFAKVAYSVMQELAIQHEIDAGWTPWVARFTIRHLLEPEQVIALAEKYIEEHKNDRYEE